MLKLSLSCKVTLCTYRWWNTTMRRRRRSAPGGRRSSCILRPPCCCWESTGKRYHSFFWTLMCLHALSQGEKVNRQMYAVIGKLEYINKNGNSKKVNMIIIYVFFSYQYNSNYYYKILLLLLLLLLLLTKGFQWSIHFYGYRSSRHQGISPPTISPPTILPPRNHLATNH